MNRLKSEEDVVRRAAGEFDSLLKNTDRMLDAIAERTTTITEGRASTAKLDEEPQTIPRQSTETGPQASSLGAHLVQDEAAATQEVVAARQALADTGTVATKSRGMEKEIDAARDIFQKLTEQAQQLLAATESTAKAQREAEATQYENFTSSVDARITELVSGVSAQLAKAAAAHQAVLTTQLQEFAAKSDAAVVGFVAKSEASLDAGDEEFKRLVEHLDELESQVEEAIQRATGLSLSHAFQPGFPIWLWYFCPFDQSSSLDFRGFLERNQATEGDTQWVNYKRSPFSSRSTDF